MIFVSLIAKTKIENSVMLVMLDVIFDKDKSIALK